MTEEIREVGKEILSYCTSCKMDLGHVIVAMKGERVAKVHCNTCKKDHAFRKPKSITEPAKKRKPRKSSSPDDNLDTKSIEAEWERLMEAHKDTQFKTYNMRQPFQLGDKVKHAKFGDGIVGKMIYPNKLEIIFRDDVRILIHAGTR